VKGWSLMDLQNGEQTPAHPLDSYVGPATALLKKILQQA